MALNANILAQRMMASTQGMTNGVIALQKLGQAIAKYLIEATVVQFIYIGYDPKGRPYVGKAKGKIKSMVIVLTQNRGGMPILNIQLGQGIMTGIYTPNPPYMCAPGSMVGFPPTTITIHTSRLKSREAAYKKMAQQIVNNVKTFVPSVPCPGQYKKYTGVATPMRLS